MEKIKFLIGIFNKQLPVIEKLFNQVSLLDLTIEDKLYVFSFKVQQLYTSVEDLLKSTANTFENHIEDLSRYHFELLRRMATEIPGIRPAVFGETSLKILDKLRSFRHFIRHGYDYDLDKEELILIQKQVSQSLPSVITDLKVFLTFLNELHD